MKPKFLVLSKAVDLFLGEQIGSTHKSYQYVLNAMRDWVGPARPLASVSSDQLIEFMQEVRKRPSIKSVASVNKYVKTIRTFFNWCVKQKFIKSSPAVGLNYRRQEKAVKREKAMPEADYQRLIDFAKWDKRAYALVLFLGDTGCRIGGAAGLRWKYVDFDNNTATVTEKGKPPRYVFFERECAQALLRWRGKKSFADEDYVFSLTGKRMTNAALGQCFRRLCISAEIGSWGPHSLRHRKGYQLSDAQISPSVAAQVLGHENVQTTLEHYFPHDMKRAKEAAEQLGYKPAVPHSKVIILPKKSV